MSSFELTDKNRLQLAAAVLIAVGLFAGIWQITTKSSQISTERDTTTLTQTANQTTYKVEVKQPKDLEAISSQNTNTQRRQQSSAESEQAPTSTDTKQDKQVAGRTSSPVPALDNLKPGQLSAESAIVWNRARQEVLFGKNIHTEQPLASLTKLMTALVAYRSMDVDQATTSISRAHLQAFGDYELELGQTWRLRDLIDFMLVASANDAARAVAAAQSSSSTDGYASEFIDDMNTTAKQLGWNSTYFFNPSGLDINENLISGGYGTAYETAQMFSYILTQYPRLLTPTTQRQIRLETTSGEEVVVENTNTQITEFPEVVGSKTGYTTLAGGNLVMGFNLRQPVVIAVLGATREGRFTDMQTLYTATKKYFDTMHTHATNTIISNHAF